MIKLKIVAIFFLILIFIFPLSAQNRNGIVLDLTTGKTLAFVNIRYGDTKQGTTTDINGKFSFPKSVSQLHFFYVGYFDTLITVGNENITKVELRPKVTSLAEVEIFPGVNPAHRIIAQAIKNRKQNHPESLHSFQYVSYNKMIFTALPDSASINMDSLAKVDSSYYRLQEFINRQHFFLMESVSKSSFLEGRHHELVIASRVSGLKDPFFMLLATQFQSFSFYEPQFNIIGKNYINPLANGSLSNYFFLLHDTLYQGNDTVFIISYRPLRNKTFDGLKGLIYINTDGFAVQNVIAEPYEVDSSGLGVKIQQLYQKIDGKAWFPTQLNTTLSFGNLLVNDMPVVGLGSTYLDSIKIDPQMKKSMFRGKVNYEVAKNSNKVEESVWAIYRTDTLSQRDKNTYQFLDSVSDKHQIDAKIKAVRILSTGKIPAGIFSIPIDKFVRYNAYEKWRFGMGIETNDRLSRHFVLSSYAAYGIGDKEWKYGFGLDIKPVVNSDFLISASYRNDLTESGAAPTFAKANALSSSLFRAILITKYHWSEDYFGAVRFRVFKVLTLTPYAEFSANRVIDDYLFTLSSAENVTVKAADFDQFQAGISLRFAPGEKLLRNPDQLISLGTKYPITYIRYSRGIKTDFSQFNFNRIDIQMDKTFNMNYLGKSKIQIKGGIVMESLPWYLLYNTPSSYRDFYVFSSQNFNTMRINEFVSNRWAAIFWEHDFGRILFKKNKFFSPDWIIVHNMGWGDMKNQDNHSNLNFSTMEKGYFESGLLWNGILRSGFSEIGFGAIYRYGPYQFDTFKENITYRMTISYNF